MFEIEDLGHTDENEILLAIDDDNNTLGISYEITEEGHKEILISLFPANGSFAASLTLSEYFWDAIVEKCKTLS